MKELMAKSFLRRLGACMGLYPINFLCAGVHLWFVEQFSFQGLSGRTVAWARPGRIQCALLSFLVLVFAQVSILTEQGLRVGFAEKEDMQALCDTHGAAARLHWCKTREMHRDLKVGFGLDLCQRGCACSFTMCVFCLLYGRWAWKVVSVFLLLGEADINSSLY